MTIPTTRPLVWLYTIAGAQLLPLHDFGDLVVEDRLGDLETLTFTIRAADPKAFAVVPDVLARYGSRYYRIEELHQYRAGARALTEVYAEARWMDLGKINAAGSFSLLGQTALAGLTTILAGSGWTAAVTPASATLYSMEDLDASLLSLVRRWAGIIGREVQFDTANKTVTLVTAIGSNNGIGFRRGHNLRSVDRRYRPPVATRLYAFGGNNLEITSVNPLATTYVEDYSWYTAQGLTLAAARAAYRKDQVWVDTRYLLALNLYDAAVRRLAALAQPTISYELEVADFAKLTSSSADDISIGDTCRVRDADFGVDIATRVVRYVQHPLEVQRNEIELAYLQPGLGEVTNSETSRTIDYGATTFLVDQNAAALSVTGVITVLASIQFTSTGVATIIIGATIKGTATGTGTVRYTFAVNGTPTGPSYDFAFTAGQVEFSWPSEAAGVDASATATITWTAQVVSGAGTIAIAIGEARAWLLTKGAVGIGVNNSPNQSIQESLATFSHTLAESVSVDLISPVDLSPAQTLAQSIHTLSDSTTPPVVFLF